MLGVQVNGGGRKPGGLDCGIVDETGLLEGAQASEGSAERCFDRM